MPTTAKRPAKRGTKRGAAAKRSTGPKGNPFDRNEEPTKHAVAAEMIRKGDHSWEELKEAAGGSLSPRTHGAIIIALEEAGHRFERWQDPEYGTIYTPNPKAERIGYYEGPDARGDTSASQAAAQKRVKAMRKAGRPMGRPPAKKTRGTAKKAASTAKRGAKRAARPARGAAKAATTTSAAKRGVAKRARNDGAATKASAKKARGAVRRPRPRARRS